MTRDRAWRAWLAGVLVAAAALAQGNPTGRLMGRVVSSEGPLPGVTVTAKSPNLQGERVVQTNANGDYLFAALPPGEYTVAFDIAGFDPQTLPVRVPALQDSRLDANLSITGVTETIEVTAEGSKISEATQVGASYDEQLVENLPVARNFRDQALLAPGVAATGPQNGSGDQAITISGAMSFENLFTVNGVVVNENLRGQAFNLFIPDAVQEVSTSTAGISAEFGRFSGGVVNLLTKSGGNELSGSVRSTLNNQDWIAKPPVADPRQDKIIPTYEATLGGRIVRDRLWFFGAGLFNDFSQGKQTFLTNEDYTTTADTRRYELKLTGAITPNHTITASGIKEDRKITNYDPFNVALEPAALDSSREQPQKLQAYNYTGVFSSQLYGELQYSKREFTFVDSGGDNPDLVRGTPITDSANSYATYHAPYFCGAPCLDEQRNNENWVAKVSAFLSGEHLGSHELVAGYDTFDDVRISENHQSATDFTVQSPHFVQNGQVYPQLLSDVSYIIWWPILVQTQGTHFKTDSLFLNDRWRLNSRLSFNVGLRYDKNDGQNAQGVSVAKDSNLSPRIGASFDLTGDGAWVANASYGRYVAALANNIADSSSSAGVPATWAFLYEGPELNTDPNAPNPMTSDQVLAYLFDWFQASGFTNNPLQPCEPGSDCEALTFFSRLPGVDRQILGNDLKSPNDDEYTLGITGQLGSKATVRADLIHRKFNDLYWIQRDTTTGIVTNELGQRFDLSYLRNAKDNELSRKYDALQLQWSWQPLQSLNFGGNYTYSKTKGNAIGENAGSGPIASTAGSYPEYNAFAQNNPSGYLPTDQRHKARAWLSWDALHTARNSLNVSLLESYSTGTPYGAVAPIVIRPYVADPGYVNRPTSSLYYFRNRDAFRTDTITSTDLALNYSFRIAAGSKEVELFVEPEIFNVFNEHGALVVNQTVLTASNGGAGLLPFNPFTDTPVEGVNYRYGSNFGKATREIDFQQPRTYRLSLGVRF